MTGQERTDRLAAVHDRTRDEGAGHRLVAREQTAVVRDREHRPVDHDAGEMNGSVVRGVHRRIRCGHVDAAVSCGVARRRREEGPYDRVRRRDRPVPASLFGRGRGRREEGRGGDHHGSGQRSGEPGEASHAPIVIAGGRRNSREPQLGRTRDLWGSGAVL